MDNYGRLMAHTAQFEACLTHIFSKYCTPPPKATGGKLAEDAVMDGAALDRWAYDTNGSPFDEETKDEMREYLDVNEKGDLTCVAAALTGIA